MPSEVGVVRFGAAATLVGVIGQKFVIDVILLAVRVRGVLDVPVGVGQDI